MLEQLQSLQFAWRFPSDLRKCSASFKCFPSIICTWDFYQSSSPEKTWLDSQMSFFELVPCPVKPVNLAGFFEKTRLWCPSSASYFAFQLWVRREFWFYSNFPFCELFWVWGVVMLSWRVVALPSALDCSRITGFEFFNLHVYSFSIAEVSCRTAILLKSLTKPICHQMSQCLLQIQHIPHPTPPVY